MKWRASISLAVAEKAESQEICFVPDGNYAGFIDRYLEAEDAADRLPGPGEIVDTCGRSWANTLAFIVTPLASDAESASRRSDRCTSFQSTRKGTVWWWESRIELLSREFTAAGVNWIAYDMPALRCAPTFAFAIATLKLQPLLRHLRISEPYRLRRAAARHHAWSGHSLLPRDEVVGGGWIVKSTNKTESRRRHVAACRRQDHEIFHLSFSIGHCRIAN